MSVFDFRKYTPIDWLTSIRLVVIPWIIITTLLGFKMVTAWIILVAFTTDLMDGFLARSLKMESRRGARLDSIADASLFLTTIFSVIWFFTDFVREHLWVVVFILSLYIFQIVFALIRYGKVTSYHTYAAKIAGVVEGFFLISCFFFGPSEWLFYFTCAVGLIEEIEEISLMFILPGLQENVKGIYWVIKKNKERK